MKWFPRYPRVGLAAPRRSVPRLEQLESRQVLAVTSVSVAFVPAYGLVRDIIYDDNGLLFQYDSAGRPSQMANNVKSDAVAFDANRGLVRDIVYNAHFKEGTFDVIEGDLHERDSEGEHLLIEGHYPYGVEAANNVKSVGVAFDRDRGVAVRDVVYNNGELWEYDSAGQLSPVANDVKSVAVAFDPGGGLVREVVYNNGELWQHNSAGDLHIEDNVKSVGVTFDPDRGGEVLDVAYGDTGLLYEYDPKTAQLLSLQPPT